MKIYNNRPDQSPVGCIIWMHGLGADSDNMLGVAQQFPVSLSIRHVLLDAPVRPITLNNHYPMRAWYDIYGMRFTAREDREGILASEKTIRDTIDAQHQEGFLPHQIFLAGFSQGGAMALRTGLHVASGLGGIIALSAYLPLAAECNPVVSKETPIFLGVGSADPIVLPAWTEHAKQWLTEHAYSRLAYHTYPMEHSICMDEINDLTSWLASIMMESQ